MDKMDLKESAKVIRTRLKQKFPNQKFSVRGERYAGGSTIHVSWEDGVGYDKVTNFAGGMKNGNFDGSIDLLTNDRNSPFGNTFIDFNREISDYYIVERCKQIIAEKGLNVNIKDIYSVGSADGSGGSYSTLAGNARADLWNADLPSGKDSVAPKEKLYPADDVVPIVKVTGKKGSIRYYTYFRMTKRAIAKKDVKTLMDEGRAQFVKI